MRSMLSPSLDSLRAMQINTMCQNKAVIWVLEVMQISVSFYNVVFVILAKENMQAGKQVNSFICKGKHEMWPSVATVYLL